MEVVGSTSGLMGGQLFVIIIRVVFEGLSGSSVPPEKRIKMRRSGWLGNGC